MFSKQFTTKMIDKLYPRLTAKNYNECRQLLAKKFAVTAIALAVAKVCPFVCPLSVCPSVCRLSWPFVKTISRWHMELQLASSSKQKQTDSSCSCSCICYSQRTWGGCQVKCSTAQSAWMAITTNGGKLNVACCCCSFKLQLRRRRVRLINKCKIFK